jgi:hypothetical protein
MQKVRIILRLHTYYSSMHACMSWMCPACTKASILSCLRVRASHLHACARGTSRLLSCPNQQYHGGAFCQLQTTTYTYVHRTCVGRQLLDWNLIIQKNPYNLHQVSIKPSISSICLILNTIKYLIHTGEMIFSFAIQRQYATHGSTTNPVVVEFFLLCRR